MHTELTRSSVSVSLQLNTLTDIREFCKVLAGTDMVPKAYKSKPDDILVAILHGQEVGLPHLQALQSIAVVNGIPSIYGDAALAMVRASGKLEDFDEWIEVDGFRQDGPFPIQRYADEGKAIVAYCRSKRLGMSRERITTYSVDDAKRAKLWEKKGQNGFETPWCTVPQRMLMWRARGWNLRDQFGDVLKGLAIYEEAMDIETSPGRDGVYRPVVENHAEETKQLEDLQEKLRQHRSSNGSEQIHAPAGTGVPQSDSAGSPPAGSGGGQTLATNGRTTAVSDEEWTDWKAYFAEDPDRSQIRDAVLKAAKLSSMDSMIPSARPWFLKKAQEEAAKRGVTVEV